MIHPDITGCQLYAAVAETAVVETAGTARFFYEERPDLGNRI